MSDKYEFIDAEYATGTAAPTITQMCEWLEASRSGFYEWRSRPESATAKRQQRLRLLIRAIFDDSDGTYGYRHAAAQLACQGVVAGLELVRKLMREMGLVACAPSRYLNRGKAGSSRWRARKPVVCTAIAPGLRSTLLA